MTEMPSDYFSPRSFFELKKDEAGRYVIDRNHAKPLESYRDEPVYVLLGQPGSGKTTAFKKEAEQPGCKYITARNFITFSRETFSREEWRGKTLFIDGLDEVRVIRKNDPFDEIRAKLDLLKPPRFRIACREADWDSADDRERLAEVSPGRDVKELFLAELEENEIEQILINVHQMSAQEASSFIQKVAQDELTALIKNPQTLEMLVRVAKKHGLPKKRSEVFQWACKELLLTEQNPIHDKAHISQTSDSEKLMRAAGALCATLLLAGKEGFVELRKDADEDHPFIGDLDIDNLRLLPLVARTKLFIKPGKYIKFKHRTYAEYLSAYYLSWKIERGLPVGKALASLERGEEMIPELRGVLAWLATLHSQERSRLMRRDPLGVALYGDVSLFDKEQRLTLLDELGRQAEEEGWSGINYWNMQSFGGFCQADMEQEFLSSLQSTDHRNAQKQWRLFYVLAAMFHGEALPNLSDALETLIRKPEARAENRRAALAILIRFGDEGRLQAILQDVHRNIIIDSKDDFLGMLLSHLYSKKVAPSELFDYLHSPKAPNYIGDYWFFWNAALEKKSDDEQVHQLLDALVNKKIATENLPLLSDLSMRGMTGKLLARGLEKFGDVIEVEQLSNWLALARDELGSMQLDRIENSDVISSWIKQRPEIQKKLMEHYLEKCLDSGDFGWCMFKKARWLLSGDFNLFEDYVRLCLNKARESSNEKMAEWLFEQSVGTLYGGKGNVDRSLELIEEAVKQDPRLAPHWERLRIEQIDRDYRVEYRKLVQESKEKRQQEEEKRRKYTQSIEKHLPDIETGMASPAVFHNLGAIYYGFLLGVVSANPRERLRNYFKDNPGLVDPILTGLQNFLRREDLPKVEVIIKLNNERALLFYSLPCLAGMNELGQKGKQEILDLGEDNIKKALTIYFTYPNYRIGAPEWYKILLKEKPDWVADVYKKYGKESLRAGKSPNMIYALADDEDHAHIARKVSIPLLRSVPDRIPSKQPDILYPLLNAALQRADENQLKEEVRRKKIRLEKMNLHQRANWLTVGFILDMEGFETLLRQFIAKRKSRIDYLTGFLSCRIDQWSSVEQWSPVEKMSPSALVLFVGLFGPRRAPYQLPSSGSIDNPEYELSGLISQMIHRLQDIDVAPGAIEAIKELLNRPDLAEWHPRLRTALQAQRGSRLPAVSLEQVCRTLKIDLPANAADYESSGLISQMIHRSQDIDIAPGTIEAIEELLNRPGLAEWHPRLRTALQDQHSFPASAADLASLTCEHIRALAERIKNGNTNDYRQYWILDRQKQLQDRQHEEVCRDMFLSDLQQRLSRHGVDAQPEGRYASDTRADIRVSYRDRDSELACNVPIEIKCDDSPDLWHGIRDQLSKKYAQDPEADGHGIYLVFWFGSKSIPSHPQGGRRPETPEKLQALLEQPLDNEKRKKIAVCIVDCTGPG